MGKLYEQAVKQGAKAFADGESGDANPFPRTSNTSAKGMNRRSAWYKGYYEARYDMFIEKLDEKRKW